MRISSFFIPLAYPSPCEVPLNLLQGPALSLRYLAPAVEQRDQGKGAEQEEHPIAPIAFLIVRNETVTTKLAAQLAMVATLIAAPRIPRKREWPYKLYGHCFCLLGRV